MICQAAEAEKIIRDTGHLIGGTFVLGRPIDASGAVEISGNTISLTEAYQAKVDADQRAFTAAWVAREAERERLRALGVSFEDSYLIVGGGHHAC